VIDNGRKRVIIEKISPEIDAGRYPVKRVPGEKMGIRANVISDGHDIMTVMLLYRHESMKDWNQKELTLLYNDEWISDFTVHKKGTYFYTVNAWIDSFKTWRAGINKKIKAGVDISVDLEIGVNILEQAAARATDMDAQDLKNAAESLREKKPDFVRIYEEDFLEKIVSKYPDPELVSSYGSELKVLVEREKALFSSWYEMFPRSCSGTLLKHGTFKDCESCLPEIKEMGFDVIYFPPIHPIGEVNRKGRNNALIAGPGDFGSPWAVGSKYGGHKSVNPLLGTMEEFEYLVKRADMFGIEIALDIAFNCAPDHPYLTEHPAWFNWKPDGSVQYAENPPKVYEDIAPFFFECEDWIDLWEELKSVFVFWINKGVRIFRVDNPHTKPFFFWEWVTGEIKKDYPDVIFLAEAFTRPKMMYHLAKAGFTQSYTYFTWRNTKQELEEYLTELTRTELREFFFPNFWPNTPDILHEYLQHGGRPAHLIRLVLAATLSSNYGIYGGAFITCQMEAFPGKEEYNSNEKYEVKNWDLDAPGNIKHEVTLINKIRRENPALHTPWSLNIRPTDNKEIMFYIKTTDDFSSIVMTVVNLDPHNKQAGYVSVPLDLPGLVQDSGYEVEDLITGNVYVWKGEWNYVELDPAIFPAHVLKLIV